MTTPKVDFAPAYGDFIVFVDESGDHGLGRINQEYPVFVLSFVIFKKVDYAQVVVPKVTEFKLRWFGHDRVALHSRDIRKSTGAFGFLRDPNKRGQFLTELTSIIDGSPMTVVAAAIDKNALKERYVRPANPYELAAKFCVERCGYHLSAYRLRQRVTHFVFESRGKKEDRELRAEFCRLCDGHNYRGRRFKYEAHFASKASISAGLELADLVSYPIGRHVIDPAQSNRAWESVERKFRRRSGNYVGAGLKVFPS